MDNNNYNYKEINDFADAILFSKNEKHKILYGVVNGYNITVSTVETIASVTLRATVSAYNADTISEEDKQTISDSSEGIVKSITASQNTLDIYFRETDLQDPGIQEKYKKTFITATQILKERGYEQCCSDCGTNGAFTKLSCYHTEFLGVKILCPECAKKIEKEVKKDNRFSNVLAGTVGALIGAAIGLFSILCFSRAGLVSSLSGIIMAVCTLKGYELLSRNLNKKGIVISVVIMAVMTYLGHRLDYVIEFYEILSEYEDVTFADCFRSFRELMTYVEAWKDYFIGFLQLVAFVLLGLVPTVINSTKHVVPDDSFNKIYDVE